jgi:preprotein translocase subunit SecG
MDFVLNMLQVLFSIIVVVLILMHSGQDAGLSGAFGVGSGTGPLSGGSLIERNLTRWTIVFSILFVLNTIVLLDLG